MIRKGMPSGYDPEEEAEQKRVGPPYATILLAVPCRIIAMLAGKLGFVGQREATSGR